MISADMYQNLWSLKYMIFRKKVLLVISDQLTMKIVILTEKEQIVLHPYKTYAAFHPQASSAFNLFS